MEIQDQKMIDVQIEKETKEMSIEMQKVKEILEKDYRNLENKPQINDIELISNKSLNELGIQDKMNSLTNLEIEEILSNQF